MRNVTHNELYTRFRDGGQDALRVLVQRQHKRLVRRIVKRGVQHANAQDIAQNVYIQLVANAAKFDPTTSDVIGWMNWLADNRSRLALAPSNRTQLC